MKAESSQILKSWIWNSIPGPWEARGRESLALMYVSEHVLSVLHENRL